MPPAARPSSTRPDSMAPSAPLRRLRYFPSPASSSSRSRALRAHSDTGISTRQAFTGEAAAPPAPFATPSSACPFPAIGRCVAALAEVPTAWLRQLGTSEATSRVTPSSTSSSRSIVSTTPLAASVRVMREPSGRPRRRRTRIVNWSKETPSTRGTTAFRWEEAPPASRRNTSLMMPSSAAWSGADIVCSGAVQRREAQGGGVEKYL
mmetsp:Transcript_23336/g.57935  ORF Transcript_23336/g.57935 Transcript_23336/m.57935 type:complete len:207 (-) Transcript_23336:6-626(-)